MNEYDKLGKDIIGAAFNVRKHAGRGMLEKFYESALAYEIEQLGYSLSRQVAIPAIYRGQIIQESYRADIIVENKVIIEVKAIPYMDSLQGCQLNTYLKLSGYKLGYLINFGARDFRTGSLYEELPYEYGIYRMVNNI